MAGQIVAVVAGAMVLTGCFSNKKEEGFSTIEDRQAETLLSKYINEGTTNPPDVATLEGSEHVSRGAYTVSYPEKFSIGKKTLNGHFLFNTPKAQFFLAESGILYTSINGKKSQSNPYVVKEDMINRIIKTPQDITKLVSNSTQIATLAYNGGGYPRGVMQLYAAPDGTLLALINLDPTRIQPNSVKMGLYMMDPNKIPPADPNIKDPLKNKVEVKNYYKPAFENSPSKTITVSMGDTNGGLTCIDLAEFCRPASPVFSRFYCTPESRLPN